MNKIRIFIFLMIFAGSISAQNRVGTVAADFLSIPVGPRAVSMGGAFVAVANDVTAAFWNPGGLSQSAGSEFTAIRTDWLVGTSMNWFGINLKLDNDNAFAISFNQLDYGEEDITTAEAPNGTGEKWNAVDLAVGVTYSRRLTDRFSIGGTLKYIQSRIWNESANAFALDVGLLYLTPLEGLQLGMNIANFGTEMKLAGKDLLQPVDIDPANTGNNANITSSLDTDAWNLPLSFTVGLAYNIFNGGEFQWTIAGDAVYPTNQTPFLNGGTEFSWKNIIYFRGGYNSVFKTSAEEGLTAGVGLQYKISGVNLKVDYGYMDFGIFGGISRYSIGVGF